MLLSGESHQLHLKCTIPSIYIQSEAEERSRRAKPGEGTLGESRVALQPLLEDVYPFIINDGQWTIYRGTVLQRW